MQPLHSYRFLIKILSYLLNVAKVAAFAWYIIKIDVIFGVLFERRKVDKKRQTYMKNETCKLYSRGFWILLPNIVRINPYNFELYCFKVGPFFETQYIIYHHHHQFYLFNKTVQTQWQTLIQMKLKREWHSTYSIIYCHWLLLFFVVLLRRNNKWIKEWISSLPLRWKSLCNVALYKFPLYLLT